MTDIATREHWDATHATSEGIPDFSELVPDRRLRRFITQHLRPHPGQRLIELGAGNTAYLPQMARSFGYRVAGVDYSPLGCELARRNLEHFGVEGEIREGDLFAPGDDWVDAFDVVLTMGVAEHFDDTAAVVRAFAQYAKAGGYVLTVIPNMRGLPGALQRFLDVELYRRHVPLTPDELAAAHTRAGLTVTCATYLVGVNFWVAHPTDPRTWRRLGWYPFLALTRVAWALENRGWLRVRPNGWTSPWVIVLARA